MFDEIEKWFLLFEDHLNNYESIKFDEKNNCYKFSVVLPGVKKENVNISIFKNYRGNIVMSIFTEKDDHHDYSRRYSKKFYLSDDIDTEKVRAKLEDGILTITLPLKEQVENRIKVE